MTEDKMVGWHHQLNGHEFGSWWWTGKPGVLQSMGSWTIKKVENWRIDAFELWCQRRLLRFPWTARRSNQSILKEISPEYSLEGLKLKLRLQWFGHLIWRANSLEKILMLGEIEGMRRRGRQRIRCLGDINTLSHSIDSESILTQYVWVWANSGRWWRTGNPTVNGVTKRQTRLRDWTTNKSRTMSWALSYLT